MFSKVVDISAFSGLVVVWKFHQIYDQQSIYFSIHKSCWAEEKVKNNKTTNNICWGEE